MVQKSFLFALLFGSFLAQAAPRERILIDDDWRFTQGDPTNCPVSLLYDKREERTVRRIAEAEADGNSSNTSVTNGVTNARNRR